MYLFPGPQIFQQFPNNDIERPKTSDNEKNLMKKEKKKKEKTLIAQGLRLCMMEGLNLVQTFRTDDIDQMNWMVTCEWWYIVWHYVNKWKINFRFLFFFLQRDYRSA